MLNLLRLAAPEPRNPDIVYLPIIFGRPNNLA